MPLPLVLSVPHAGTAIPQEVSAINRLSLAEIEHDGDEGAAEIYLPLESAVAAMVSTPIARAFVDQNRSADDFRKDGVVKTHTCWDVPIYSRPLTTLEVRQLLAKYYEPYHRKLTASARQAQLGLDCHTMAAIAPPIGPDSGQRRPRICLGNDHGSSCPARTLEHLAHHLALAFDCEVALNRPFAGGYITRSRPGDIPWVQLELSREPWLQYAAKREKLIQALKLCWLEIQGSSPD
jgi:formiminoglutamase